MSDLSTHRVCAICYITDLNFLHPTLVSATSVRKRTAASPDLYIFTIDVPDALLEKVRDACGSDLRIEKMDPSRITGFNSAEFARTHVPKATLGRFFIADYLPPKYERIIYLDGDTWAVRSLDKLIEYNPPFGRIAAADDPLSFFSANWGQNGSHARNYIRGLGLSPSGSYFNAGVLLAQLSSWREIMAEAWRYFSENTGRCLYHDQSALNAVAYDRRIRLSSKWNFCSPYRLWGLEGLVQPHLYHFVGAAKPWMGSCAPWADLHDAYMDEWQKFSSLHLPARTLDDDEIARINKQASSSQRRLRSVHLLRGLRYRNQMARLLNSQETVPENLRSTQARLPVLS